MLWDSQRKISVHELLDTVLENDCLFLNRCLLSQAIQGTLKKSLVLSAPKSSSLLRVRLSAWLCSSSYGPFPSCSVSRAQSLPSAMKRNDIKLSRPLTYKCFFLPIFSTGSWKMWCYGQVGLSAPWLKWPAHLPSPSRIAKVRQTRSRARLLSEYLMMIVVVYGVEPMVALSLWRFFLRQRCVSGCSAVPINIYYLPLCRWSQILNQPKISTDPCPEFN